MTAALDLDAQLAAYRARSCTGKTKWSQGGAMRCAERMRAEQPAVYVPYACPFCGDWHVGHALGIVALEHVAELLRCRHGGQAVEPGSGTTRRQRRQKGTRR